MTTLADIQSAVQAIIASKRLGKPVFVRCVLQSEEKDAIVPRLAQLTAVIRHWLAQPLDRVYAIGSIDNGQVSLTLQFKQGATALVSFAHGRPNGDGLDLMLLGNRGAIYHDAGSAKLWNDTLVFDKVASTPALQALIERALHSGKPEDAGHEQ